MPEGEITFSLHVDGAEDWSWADIVNNGRCPTPDVNLHNEQAGGLRVIALTEEQYAALKAALEYAEECFHLFDGGGKDFSGLKETIGM